MKENIVSTRISNNMQKYNKIQKDGKFMVLLWINRPFDSRNKICA